MNEYSKTAGKLSICFVSLDNFATLVQGPKLMHIGGAEMQQAIIGRNLAERGHRVSFVTLDHGQDNSMEIDGMRIFKAYDENVGIPVLRFSHPRLTSLWRAMREADSDVYYQRKGDTLTGIVAAFCRFYRRKFVFGIASHYDCLPDLPDCLKRRERILYRYGLRRANLVLVQTVTQQKLIRENFGIDSTVVRSCAPDYSHCLSGTSAETSAQRTRLLWIGRFSPIKRLELLLEVAEKHRNLQFDVLGDGNAESEYVRRLRSRATSMPNIHLHGRVPHARVQEFYQRAAALICTSRAEGFPNTFLEAWTHGLPIVSTVDPDNLIAEHGLGVVACDAAGLAGGIQLMLDSQSHWSKASHAAMQYYKSNHSIEAVMPRLENTFLSLTNGATS